MTDRRADARAAIEALRRARGEEAVTFSDVADHLMDVLQRRPDAARDVETIARYLTVIEERPHDHDGPLGSSAERDSPRG
jgi:hypothetical protein